MVRRRIAHDIRELLTPETVAHGTIDQRVELILVGEIAHRCERLSGGVGDLRRHERSDVGNLPVPHRLAVHGCAVEVDADPRSSHLLKELSLRQKTIETPVFFFEEKRQVKVPPPPSDMIDKPSSVWVRRKSSEKDVSRLRCEKSATL